MSHVAEEAIPWPIEEMRFTVDQFIEMIEAGTFVGIEGKVELAEGRVIVAPIDGGRHVEVGARLIELWAPRIVADPALAGRMRFYSPGTVRLKKQSLRGPDGLLCPPGLFGKRRYPDAAQCFLAVEYSDTTILYDDGDKRADYARAGMPELWIVRVEHENIRVCRGPQPDGSWREADLHQGDAVIAPLAAPELAVRVGDLFA
jgi:Uma2 family endonuclease